jgi:tetratricopeptide (TPR) repeat protein
MSTHHKTGYQTKRTSRCSQPSLTGHGKVLWATVVLVFACVLVNTGFSANTPPPVRLPVVKPIRTAEGLAALKKRELALAQELLQAFPGRHDSLALMGNVWYRRGNAIEAETFWQDALTINPKQADVHRSMAWLLLKKGDYQQSIAHYRQALAIQPTIPDAYNNIGRALMMSGRHSEAIEALKKEIDVDPTSSFAFFLLGQTYSQQQEYDQAKTHYEKAIALKPNYANAYYGLIAVCTKLGQRDQAKAHSATFKKLKAEARQGLEVSKSAYDDFAETQKAAAITYVNVGRTYREHGQHSKAEKLLAYAAGLDPNNIVSYLELASLYQTTKEPAKVIQMYQHISEIQPKASLPYLAMGVLSGQLGRFADSEKAFRTLINLTPKKPDGYRELARLYLKTRKNLPLARKLAYKAVSLQASADNCFVFAWACDENRDKTNAQEAIKRAIALAPDNQSYRRLYQVIQQRK